MQLQKRHIIAVAIILLEILGIVWMFPYLPMADLPEHMLAAKVLTHYDDVETSYATFFTKKIPWNPYSSYFLFVVGSEPVLGVRNATRLYLSLAFVLTIVAFWYWIRTVAPGRDAQVLPATLLIFGGFFYIGLVNFLFSAPFLFFALAAAWRILTDDRRHTRDGVILAVSLMLAYLSHAVTFGLTGLMLFLQAVFFFRGRRIFRLVVPILPALVMLSVYLLTEARHDVSAVTLSYDPLPSRLATLLMPLSVFPDPITGKWTYDFTLLTLWSLVLAVCVIASLRPPRPPKLGGQRDRDEVDDHARGGSLGTSARAAPSGPRCPPDSGGRGGFFAACSIFFMFTSSVLFLPSLLSEGQGVAFRGAYFAAFVLVVLLPTSWDQRAWTRRLMIVVCAALPLVIAARMTGFTSEMKDLERVIAHLPPGKVLQPVITEPHSSTFDGRYSLLHAAAWYSFYKGGVSPYLIAAWAKHFPVHTREQLLPHAAGEWQMNKFRYEANETGTDYFLVRTQDAKILADLKEHVPEAASEGSWVVFGPNR